MLAQDFQGSDRKSNHYGRLCSTALVALQVSRPISLGVPAEYIILALETSPRSLDEE